MSEAALGEVVVRYLEDLDWEVFQEVSWRGMNRADLVARKEGRLWIIELKKTFGFGVLAQANEWIYHRGAHMVSVATPMPKPTRRNRRPQVKDYHFRCAMARHVGCGWLQVRTEPSAYHRDVTVEEKPRLHRRLGTDHIGNHLHENQKTAASAGSKGGGYWTPFQGTSQAILSLVHQQPGISLKELIEKVDHHYASDASARTSIRKWVEKGVIKGVTLQYVGRTPTLHPKKLD